MESATCQDVNAVGITGYIPPQECSVIQSQQEIIETCGCGKKASVEGTDEAQELSFPSCYICGSESVPLGRPNADLSLPPSLGCVDSVTCEAAIAMGMTGYIPLKACSEIQASIFEQCGCGLFRDDEDEGSEGNTTIITSEEFEESSFPSCYLCGSENIFLGNPGAILNISSELGYGDTASCQEMNTIGISGNIVPQGCSAMQSQSSILQKCGCGDFYEERQIPLVELLPSLNEYPVESLFNVMSPK